MGQAGPMLGKRRTRQPPHLEKQTSDCRTNQQADKEGVLGKWDSHLYNSDQEEISERIWSFRRLQQETNCRSLLLRLDTICLREERSGQCLRPYCEGQGHGWIDCSELNDRYLLLQRNRR